MIPILKLFRFPLVFTAVADSAAGFLIFGGAPRALPLALLAVASAGLYFFGMAMNDVADRGRDRTLHPDRVLPSGKLSVRGAVVASLFALAVSGAAVTAMPRTAFRRTIFWGGAVLFILLYDFKCKLPPFMGLIRALNFLLGAADAFWGPPWEIAPMDGALYFAAALFVYVTGLTFISTLEEGKGSKRMMVFGVVSMALAAAAPVFIGRLCFASPYSDWGWAASAPLIAWIAWRVRKDWDREGIMKLVRDGVAGVILLDASMVLSAGHWLRGPAVAALLIPAVLFVWLFTRA